MSTNDRRAAIAAEVLNNYWIWQGPADEDKQIQLQDLLTDLRHFADAHDLDFHEALDASYTHYLEEIQEEAPASKT